MKPFPTTDGEPFKALFGEGTFTVTSLSKAELIDRVKVKKWFRTGDEVLYKDVPFPKNQDGEKLPHGAVLDFDQIPIRSEP